MNHTFDSHDREHLSDLMADFPVKDGPDIDLASKLIHLRFDKLDSEQFVSALAPLTNEVFAERMHSLPWKMHRYLFNGILSNAGLYRNMRDPQQGSIYFGPNQQFSGYNPPEIVSGVKEACSLLSKNSSNPISSVVRFYQLLVYVHPFYDANGRIGRFITNIYLNYHGLYLSWKRLHQNQKWIKKLNNCHKRFGQETFEQYVQILTNYWDKFILRKEDIDPLQ